MSLNIHGIWGAVTKYLIDLSLSKKTLIAASILGGAGIVILKYRSSGAMHKSHSKTKLKDKVVLITNATNSLGQELVKDLKARGAKVYMACKDDLPLATQLCQKLNADEPNPKVHVIPLDLSCLNSIHACVKSFRSGESSLDILINNSRTDPLPFSVTQNGEDINRQVIYLGHYLLSRLVVDLKPRIINVGSQLISCAAPSMKWQSYIQSKVELVYLGLELSRQYPELQVCMAVPGYIENTTLVEFPCYALRKVLASPYFRPSKYTPFMGAQSILYCCLADSISAGQIYCDGKIWALCGSHFSSTSKVWRRSMELWEESGRQAGYLEDNRLDILD